LQYLGLYNPVFKRRHAILSGEAEPTPEEIKAGEEQSLKDDPDTTPLPAKDEDGAGNIKGIPEFWLTALRNHVGISDLITERDEGVSIALASDLTDLG
jgi:nucleosome assembly protein 1-like 1